jgi:hypothetical protein
MTEKRIESDRSEDETMVGRPYDSSPVDMPSDPDAGLSAEEKKAIVNLNLRTETCQLILT